MKFESPLFTCNIYILGLSFLYYSSCASLKYNEWGIESIFYRKSVYGVVAKFNSNGGVHIELHSILMFTDKHMKGL